MKINEIFIVKFERYPHISDLFQFYSNRESREDIAKILCDGITNESDAEKLCVFAWEIAGYINDDCENGVVVLGSQDNSDMIPDLSYELTRLMKLLGYYSVWQSVSDREMN